MRLTLLALAARLRRAGFEELSRSTSRALTICGDCSHVTMPALEVLRLKVRLNAINQTSHTHPG